jgi:hypothetical protein
MDHQVGGVDDTVINTILSSDDFLPALRMAFERGGPGSLPRLVRQLEEVAAAREAALREALVQKGAGIVARTYKGLGPGRVPLGLHRHNFLAPYTFFSND